MVYKTHSTEQRQTHTRRGLSRARSKGGMVEWNPGGALLSQERWLLEGGCGVRGQGRDV